MRGSSLLKEYFVVAAIAILIAFFIRFFFLEAYRIPTSVMQPELLSGDVIFVSKKPFGYTPVRSDVVVFWVPGDANRDVIKRVVGLPGDTVLIRDGKLSVNQMSVNINLDQTHKDIQCGSEYHYQICIQDPIFPNFGPEEVPADHVFVLPDFRTEPKSTHDSRPGTTWGMIPVKNIFAKASFVWFSIEPKVSGDSRFWWSRFRGDRFFKGIK